MRSVAVELTARCNQKCTYCYNAWRDDGGSAMGELDSETLLAMLTQLIEANDLRYLTLTGGEPFARKDIHEIIDFINGRGLGVVIISNGGLIRQETVERLSRQHIHYIQITLAGPNAAIHNAVAGSGSFERIDRAFRALQAGGITVGGSFLCTSQSYGHAEATLERFVDYGVQQVAFNRFNPSGFSRSALDLMPTRSQVVEALTATNAVAERHDLKVVCTMPIPPCVVDYREFPRIRFGQCSAGVPEGELAIGPDGAVKLCTLQQKAVGNVFQHSLLDLLNSPATHEFRAQVPEFCKGCLYQDTCLGGCGAAAEWVLGEVADLDPFVAQHVLPDFAERADERIHLPTQPLALDGKRARLRS